MGHLQAAEMANELPLSQALHWHLTANHYPPVPSSMVGPCIEAIEAFWDEDYNRLIELPDGILWRGRDHAPASAIVEAHHLDAWLVEDEFEDDWEDENED